MSAHHTDSLAVLLREKTRADHHRLDHHPALAVLVRPAVATADYAAALAALHGAYATIEAALEGYAPAALFPPRTPDLAADLADLGCRPLPSTLAAPRAATAASRLGMMYVLEGSGLGGRVIAKHLSTRLPAGLPRRFFGQGGVAERWQRFWDFAGQRCAAADHAQVVEAARATFAFFHAHLDRCASGANAEPAP